MGCCQAVWQFSKHSVVIPLNCVTFPSASSHLDPMHLGTTHLKRLTPNYCPLFLSQPHVQELVSLSLTTHPSSLFFFFLSSPCPTGSQLPGASLHKPQLFKVNMPHKFNFSNPHTSEPLRFQGVSLKRRISRLLKKKSKQISKMS